ncbi:FAD/NAD(P)-binding domain-containing protein [Lophium mytilinum]|uniref:FAD/NAD(P)-binding domain-containing protein n=1 Tax=Lophium mytilinum TaxID=390894 RepID=A0A6A6R1A9_9PEZI|nr:FAD/NAD(P)-binding domain-containing protein [Lophium mytilinum]
MAISATQALIEEIKAQAKAIPTTDARGYSIEDKPLGSRRPIKVVCIGFGASAINIAHKLSPRIKEGNVSLQCYEKNPEIGGTWYENTYPGCACDIPAVNYTYSWHVKPDWTTYYAKSQEILAYFKDVVATHSLGEFCKLNHRVVGAWWNEDLGEWKIEVQRGDNVDDTFEDTANILINATGVLNHWKWPAVPGVEKFKRRIHTSAWNNSIDLTNKTVGVIGNGSSAVQVIPAIFPKIKKMKCFIRSSSWVTSGFASKFAGEHGENITYTEEQKKHFAEHPDEYLKYRKAVELEVNQNFAMMIKGSPQQLEALEFARMEMSRKLNEKQHLIDKLVPKEFAVGCRRPTPGNGYLECIADEEKCDVSFSSITEITEKGIITADGVEHEIDVLICATGFDVSFRPRYPIVGQNGLDMRDAFAEHAQTYLSMTTPNFPNYFMMLGPFGPYGHGSVISSVEVITRHIEKIITKMQLEDVKSFAPRQAAVDDFKQHRELYLKRTAWDSPCRSWFKGGKADGPIMMWPGSRLHFFDALENPRWEDYDWSYRTTNRFGFWGNGFSTMDTGDDERDSTWYIGEV